MPPKAKTESDYRAELCRLMDQTVAEQAAHRNWTYAFVRPQAVAIPVLYPAHPAVDCSDGCRALAHAAGVPDDPAGSNYATYGNSTSIWTHLDHVAPGAAEPGDIITFGRSQGESHACMIRSTDGPMGSWRVWNMGTQGQPVFRTVQNELDGHPGQTATICRLNLPPDPPPTPADKLRARTGYWTWLQWRLGEGHWRRYAPADRTVRPAVPKVIPPAWWRRLAAFKLRRKRGDKPTSK